MDEEATEPTEEEAQTEEPSETEATVETEPSTEATEEATADTLDEALKKAYAAVEKISFEGAHYRHDIGKTK